MTKQLVTRILIAVGVVGFGLLGQASAQMVEDITFSRPPGELMVSEVEFTFNDLETEVQIDQLGAANALFQNNDVFGQDFGLTVASSVDSIGEVTVGQVLSPGTNFGNSSLLVSDFIAPGENFYLGFSSGADVGYFNISWDPGANSSIHYSDGQFASDGASLIVAAVPETSTIALGSMLGLLAFIRRRRG